MPGEFSCVAEPGHTTLVMTQTFDASREDVFEAWTRTDEVKLWWDPSGAPLAICEIDLRPDGAFRWVNQGDTGKKYPFCGTYCEIAPPERLVFKARVSPESPEMLTTLVFTERRKKATLTMTILCPNEHQRDALLAMRIDAGTKRTLQNLAAHLHRRQA